MDLTTLPPVVPRDPPTLEEVNGLVDAFVAQLQWTDKAETGGYGAERQAREPQHDEHTLPEEKVSRSGARPRLDRDKEERDA
jgi:type IV secretion system protein VirD4